MMVTILPWVVRNKLVLGHPVLFKDGFWLEVCVGNVNNTLHWWDGSSILLEVSKRACYLNE